jgi:hypothetical protein
MPAPRSRAIAGIATLTTLASRNPVIEARTVAAISATPGPLRNGRSEGGWVIAALLR